MKRKTPKECPKCKSKQISYETYSAECWRNEESKDIIRIESEFTCMECDETFYHTADYELGFCLSEMVYT